MVTLRTLDWGRRRTQKGDCQAFLDECPLTLAVPVPGIQEWKAECERRELQLSKELVGKETSMPDV